MINQKDYKSLYYKYKKKYLILKKEQKGGSKLVENPTFDSSSINMSGPVSITYLSNENKKIILIGDRHHSNFSCKEDSIDINSYINTLFDSKDIENFDLFIKIFINEKSNR